MPRRPGWSLVVALLLAAASSGCGGEGRVSGPEARRLVEEEGATLLDVRSDAEFSAGHLEGALHIPEHALADRLDEVDRGRPVVVYCHSGGRSATATSLLRERGYTAHDLGPMSAWD